MTPTNKLRFVERNKPVILNGERFDNWQKVLQQWHEWDVTYPTQTGEWRDVPTVKEQP